MEQHAASRRRRPADRIDEHRRGRDGAKPRHPPAAAPGAGGAGARRVAVDGRRPPARPRAPDASRSACWLGVFWRPEPDGAALTRRRRLPHRRRGRRGVRGGVRSMRLGPGRGARRPGLADRAAGLDPRPGRRTRPFPPLPPTAARRAARDAGVPDHLGRRGDPHPPALVRRPDRARSRDARGARVDVPERAPVRRAARGRGRRAAPGGGAGRPAPRRHADRRGRGARDACSRRSRPRWASCSTPQTANMVQYRPGGHERDRCSAAGRPAWRRSRPATVLEMDGEAAISQHPRDRAPGADRRLLAAHGRPRGAGARARRPGRRRGADHGAGLPVGRDDRHLERGPVRRPAPRPASPSSPISSRWRSRAPTRTPSSRPHARASSRPGDAERRRLERNLHDGAQQRLVSLSLALRLARARLEADPGRRTRCSRRPARSWPRRSRSSASWRAASTPPSSPTAGSRPALEALAGRSPVPVGDPLAPGGPPARPGRGGRVLRRVGVARERGEVRGRIARRRGRRVPRRVGVRRGRPTTAPAAPTRPAARGCSAWPTASRRWPGTSTSRARRAPARACGPGSRSR